MSTPEELLCQRKWRLSRGLWMLWGWVPFGWLAGVGYFIIGFKAKNWKWITVGAAFWVYTIGTFVATSLIQNQVREALGRPIEKGELAPEPYNTFNVIWVSANMLVWIGNAAVAQWLVNRRWLVWRARNEAEGSQPWYATATATAGGGAAVESPSTSTIDAALLPAGPTVSTQPAPQVATPSPRQLDLNAATRDQLALLPGIDMDSADHIITTRDRIGGYSQPADLVTAASVQPHVFAAISQHLTIETPPTSHPSAPETGRRLEF